MFYSQQRQKTGLALPRVLSRNIQKKYNFNSTMDDMFEFGTQDFVTYERLHKEKQSRHVKKEIKLTKLKADLEDPQQRKIRYQMRRQQEKAKLQKQLEGLNEEQARIYLDKKRQRKIQAKEKCVKALETGMPILLDLVYEKKMNAKENKSLAVQIQLIMKTIKHIDDPPGIHLCSVQGGIKNQLEKMRYNYWTLTSSQDDVVAVGKKLDKKLVYLSPDAPDPLEKIEPDTAYIIGGLVDRTVIKNASYNRARDLDIPAAHLPIREFMKNRYCLNLDHVVTIMSKYKECGDWKVAFDYGAPKRWKKGEEEKKKTESEEQEEEKQQKQQKKEENSNQEKNQ